MNNVPCDVEYSHKQALEKENAANFLISKKNKNKIVTTIIFKLIIYAD